MPYKTNKDLPKAVRDNLPEHAQDIYRKVYNSAHKQYKGQPGDLEERASKIAWAAVKRLYEKNKQGKWVKK